MNSSGFVKFFLAFTSLICASCGVWQSPENSNSSVRLIENRENDVPFPNKEPETFQAEIIVKNFAEGSAQEKRYFLARSGARRLTVFNRGEKNETSVLQTAEGKTFFINNEKKTFRENEIQTGRAGGELLEFLTTEWLNQKTGAARENLGTENNLTKYRIVLDGAGASEILIFIDENLKLPVRQEFYSVSGERKTLTLSVEMKNFLPSADENLFKLPQDYKRL
jgi:hypothetical protein